MSGLGVFPAVAQPVSVALSVLLACTACGDAPSPFYAGGTFLFRFVSAGLDRQFRMHVPRGLDPRAATPLLFVFHGSGTDGAWMEEYTLVNAPADAAGFIVVYPDAADTLTRTWTVDAGTPPDEAGIDDFTFVADVIDLVSAELSIDPDRIFAAGFSNGALFVQRLGCVMGDRFAGIASVAATMLAKVAGYCTPSKPLQALFFHGTKDVTMGWDGAVSSRFTLMSAPEMVEFWAGLNACGALPEITAIPDAVPDSTTVEQWRYTGCLPGGETLLYAVIGGGHVWPGASRDLPLLGCTTQDISASALIVEHFSRGTYTAPPPPPDARTGCTTLFQ